MMSKTITNYMISFAFIILFISACKKQESYLQATGNYATVNFIDNSTLGAANFGVKYNGEPIAQPTNAIVLTGLGKFTFYNKITQEVLLEKELDIKANDKDPWYFFQPDATINPQLIRNQQVSEPDAPADYMKLKVVNFSKIGLTNNAGIPYAKVDMVIQSTLVNAIRYAPVDTINAIGSNLDTAHYYLVKQAVRAGAIQTKYKFGFLDHETKEPILNSGGTLYTTAVFTTTQTGRNVYTIYLSDSEAAENSGFLFKNNKYYDLKTNLLFPE